MQPQVPTPMPDTIRPAASRRALAWALWSCAAVVFVASLAFGSHEEHHEVRALGACEPSSLIDRQIRRSGGIGPDHDRRHL